MISEITRDMLIQKAIDAMAFSYSPYSGYPVGAALLTDNDEVFSGTNIENAAYPTSMCAERTAIFKAVSEDKKNFKAMAVVTKDGASPCGSCRQVMAEFALDMQVFIADANGKIHLKTTVKEFLPKAFGPGNLL
ncbi:MAG: cytidine deaminase [Chloroflexota bacterium]